MNSIGPNKKSYLILTLKACVSCSLLYLIFNDIQLKDLMNIIGNTNTGSLPYIFCIYLLQITLMSFRWNTLLDFMNYSPGVFACFKNIWAGEIFNQALPSTIGGDIFRAYALHEKSMPLSLAIKSIIIDRLLGLIGLVFLILVCAPLSLYFYFGTELRATYIIFFSSIIITCIILILTAFFIKSSSRKNYIILTILKIKAEILPLLKQQNLLAKLISYSITIHIGSILIIILLCQSLRLEIPLIALAAIVPIMSLLSMMPISISGWGIREAIMIYGLKSLLIPQQEVLSLSVLYGLSLAACSIPGGIFILQKQK